MRGQLIPEDLAQMAPGPELARVLAGVDLSGLSGFECVEVLRARYRQLNHDKAGLMATMVEVGLRDGEGDGRMAEPDEFSADEIRAALVLTRRAAAAQLELAYDLVTRLPAVHAAMDAGVLDEPKARVFADWTLDLSDDQARALCGDLLPRAPGWTTGQLVERIKRHAIALDPDWAQRRYEHAVADRRVVGYRNPDGSANLSGVNLPVDRVAAASGRIDALAKAAKHAGDGRPIDHIRADLFLGMTDGTYTGLDEAAIIGLVFAAAPAESNSGDTCGGAPQDIDDSDAAETEPAAEGARLGQGMELRVRLTTLLGRDQHPAELAGWGPVHAELARDLVHDLGAARRYAITDDQGQLQHAGITRARPTGTSARAAPSRAIMELQVPEIELRALAADPEALGAWAPVIADLTRLLGSRTNESDHDRRAPAATLRRWLQTRDRTCVMVGCRNPARSADQDHTIDHATGGPSIDTNLGAACRHDHRLKHEGGWGLHQPEPGAFHWTSRLGHHYQRSPPPIIEPLPDPIPRDLPPDLEPPAERWCAPRIWEHPPSEPEPPPSADPGPNTPPF